VAPNPFNPRTTFGFTLARDARVELAVYDVRGRLVRRVLDEAIEAGAHPGQASWDGNDDQGRAAPSGTYFLRMKTSEGFSEARKMTLLR
jgi:flagellar hook assembly protein FlgD